MGNTHTGRHTARRGCALAQLKENNDARTQRRSRSAAETRRDQEGEKLSPDAHRPDHCGCRNRRVVRDLRPQIGPEVGLDKNRK